MSAPDPFSSLFAMAIGTGVSAVSKNMEGDAAAANAIQESLGMQQQANATRVDAEGLRYDAASVRLAAKQTTDEALAAEYNAALNDQNASEIRSSYAENERRLRVKSTVDRGQIRAQFGGGGLQLTGTALDILAQTAETQELDALTLRHEGDVKAIAEENSAKLNRMKASSARANASAISDRANFIDTKANFVDQQASFIDERAKYVAGTAPKLQQAGNLKAIGTLASGAASLIGLL